MPSGFGPWHTPTMPTMDETQAFFDALDSLEPIPTQPFLTLGDVIFIIITVEASLWIRRLLL